MSTEVKVPTLGESVTEATIGQWFKKAGDRVEQDETIAELETDKVTVEVPAPAAGVLSEILVKEGETVEVGALIAVIGEGAAGGASAPKGDAAKAALPVEENDVDAEVSAKNEAKSEDEVAAPVHAPESDDATEAKIEAEATDAEKAPVSE